MKATTLMTWNQALNHVREGGFLGYPTDTLWGLGCRADHPDLVRACLDLKGPGRHGLASVVLDPNQCANWVHVPVDLDLSDYFPGPYTLILPIKDMDFEHLKGPGDTLGCRVPRHPALIEMVTALGCPLVTTSLNMHGVPPARSLRQARDVCRQMAIPLVGEDVTLQGASTILRWSGQGFEVLRQGLGVFPPKT